MQVQGLQSLGGADALQQRLGNRRGTERRASRGARVEARRASQAVVNIGLPTEETNRLNISLQVVSFSGSNWQVAGFQR